MGMILFIIIEVLLLDQNLVLEIENLETKISNRHARETFRQQSYTAPHCRGVISAFGFWVRGIPACRAVFVDFLKI